MPRGDGTGPMGMGAKTGRSAGYCMGFNTPGYANTGFAQGRGAGCGRGFRRMCYAAGIPVLQRNRYYNQVNMAGVNERETLENHEKALETQLETVRQRLKEYEKEERE